MKSPLVFTQKHSVCNDSVILPVTLVFLLLPLLLKKGRMVKVATEDLVFYQLFGDGFVSCLFALFS